jgi:hypothetical protein
VQHLRDAARLVDQCAAHRLDAGGDSGGGRAAGARGKRRAGGKAARLAIGGDGDGARQGTARDLAVRADAQAGALARARQLKPDIIAADDGQRPARAAGGGELTGPDGDLRVAVQREIGISDKGNGGTIVHLDLRDAARGGHGTSNGFALGRLRAIDLASGIENLRRLGRRKTGDHRCATQKGETDEAAAI